MIQEQPLQVYASILVFSPTDSIIRQWFQAETPKWLVAPEMIDQSWSAQVGALEHGANITAFAPSPDGKITVSVCKQKIRIWDMASSHCFMTLEAPGEVLRLSFSPDSRLFATASVDGAICVWDTISWCITANFSGPTEAPVSLKFSTDSRRIAAAFENHKTHVWDVADGICVQVARPRIKDKAPISIGLLQDDLTKVTVFENGETHVWNEWGRSIRKMTIGHGRDLSDSNIAFSENGRFLLCWSPDWFCKVMGLEIWDLESGQCTKNIPMERIIDSAALSSDGKYAGIVRLGTFFEIWDLMAECCIMKFKTGYSPVEALAFSMDAQQIIAQLKSGTLAIFDIASEHSVKLMEDGDEDEEQDEEQADMMVLSHDGQRTASICRGITTIKGVDGPSFKVTTRKRFSSLVFSPSDQNIAITYTNGSIEVWDASKGDCLNRFEGADDWRGPVSLATNDKDIAFVTSRCTFKIESIAASSMLCGLEFMGHGPLAFNKAGDRIAAGFDEKQIKLWSLTGECLACLQHTGDVIAVAVSPNDQHIATVSESTAWTVNIWDISGEWLKTMHLWSDGVYPSVSMLGQPFYIYFEDKGSRLHMTYNTLDLGPCELIPLAKGVVSAEYSGYGLSNEMEWITYKGQNVLWVPPDSRPWKWSIAPLTVATVNALKRVIYFRFADEGLSTPF
jgi:WD40 repeat protein